MRRKDMYLWWSLTGWRAVGTSELDRVPFTDLQRALVRDAVLRFCFYPRVQLGRVVEGEWIALVRHLPKCSLCKRVGREVPSQAYACPRKGGGQRLVNWIPRVFFRVSIFAFFEC